MAIQSDDWDIKKSWLYTEAGGNGDYYITIAEERTQGGEIGSKNIFKHSIRITTSGSRYPSDVMLAVSNLHKTLSRYKLDSNELNKELEFKRHIVGQKPYDFIVNMDSEEVYNFLMNCGVDFETDENVTIFVLKGIGYSFKNKV